MLTTTTNWISHHRMALMYGAAFVVELCAAGLLSLPGDSPPLLQRLFAYTKFLGLAVTCATPSLRCFLAPSFDLLSFARQLAHAGAALLLVLSAVVSLGNDTLAWLQHSPWDAAAFVIAMAAAWFIARFASPHSTPSTGQGTSAGRAASAGVLASSRPARVPTPHDDKVTATHEAGHALLYAAFDKLPADFEAVVGQNSRTGSLGFISRVVEGNLLTSRTFAEWRMLMLLAGMEAERTLHGVESLGGASDYRAWLVEAHVYLANGFRGPFYAEPIQPDQVLASQLVLKALQAEHETVLAALFTTNRHVLEALADELLERRRLSNLEVAPFLSQVVLPDGFPRPPKLRHAHNATESSEP